MKSRQSIWAVLRRLWPAYLIFGLWLVFFWSMISGQTVAGFRDSAYLYYPLFWWIDHQMAAGELPLWNPYCGFGYPLVADGTSSVFYPGKLIFFLPFLDFPTRYGNFLAVHILVAAGGAYWLARTMKADAAGATLAAIGYAFGGSVLFQVNNCPFLISAAWLPFALVCVWRMIRTSEIRWILAGAIFCGLMILGGDPQMVYHVGLIGLATIAGGWWRKRGRFARSKQNRLQRPYHWAGKSIAKLAAMSALTGLLAAIQLLPSYVWSQESERSFFYSPRSVYEIIESNNWPHEEQKFDVLHGIFGRTDTNLNEHVGHIYQFSQPPWSLGELIWPNFSGRMFPLNTRWTNKLPGADRVWHASLYSGCFVFVLMILSFRLWGRQRRFVWLTRIALFFAIASFGWYGPVWLVRELTNNPEFFRSVEVGLVGIFGEQVGGLYWLMVTLLPKYVVFRYPAKLFVIASLAICVLAGISWKRLFQNRIRTWCLFEVIAGASILLALFGTRPWDWIPINIEFAFGGWFGPFLTDECAQGLFYSFGTIAVVLIVFRLTHAIAAGRFKPVAQGLLLGLFAVELLFSNYWLTAQVPASAFADISSRGGIVEELQNEKPPRGLPGLITSSSFENPRWFDVSSPERLSEIVAAQMANNAPKFHLGHSKRNLHSFASINSVYFQEYFNWMLRRNVPPYEFAFVESLPPGSVQRHIRSQVFMLLPRWESAYAKLDDQVRVINFENEKMNFEIDIPGDGWLLIREQYSPGWKARCFRGNDEIGQPAELKRLGPFRAVQVQSGKQRIELSYRPVEFYVGAAISCFSWLVLVVISSVWYFRIRLPWKRPLK